MSVSSLSRFAWLNPWYNPYKILLVSSICSRFRNLYYVIYFTCLMRIWINIFLSNLFSYPINYTLYVVIRSCDNIWSLWINGNLGIKKYPLFIVLRWRSIIKRVRFGIALAFILLPSIFFFRKSMIENQKSFVTLQSQKGFLSFFSFIAKGT